MYIQTLDILQFRYLFPFEGYIPNEEDGEAELINREIGLFYMRHEDISYENCRLIYFDSFKGSLYSALAFTNDILETYNPNLHPPITKLSVRNSLLRTLNKLSELIPQSVIYLNLEDNTLINNSNDDSIVDVDH